MDLTKPPPTPAPTKPVAASSPRFSTTDREATSHGIKMMIYGRAGTGKTTFCGSAPAPLIISAEAGLLSLRNKSIPVILVETREEVDNALVWCKTDAINNGIQTVCLDSISEIAEKVLVSERAKTKDPRQAYGELASQTIQLVKDFRDISGLHVIVTAKQTIATDPVTGVTMAQPTSPGQQVGPALPYLFDEVFHSFTDKDAQGKTYHAIRTRASFNAEAKDRSGVLDEIEFPDATNIINKIMGAL